MNPNDRFGLIKIKLLWKSMYVKFADGCMTPQQAHLIMVLLPVHHGKRCPKVSNVRSVESEKNRLSNSLERNGRKEER